MTHVGLPTRQQSFHRSSSVAVNHRMQGRQIHNTMLDAKLPEPAVFPTSVDYHAGGIPTSVVQDISQHGANPCRMAEVDIEKQGTCPPLGH